MDTGPVDLQEAKIVDYAFSTAIVHVSHTGVLMVIIKTEH